MIKLVVADCDGTILDSNKKIDSKLNTTIKQLNKKNILFTLASGRNIYLMKEIINELDIKLPVIINNGANIYQEGKMIEGYSLERNYNSEICNSLMSQNFPFLAYSENVVIYYSNHELLSGFKLKLKNKIQQIEVDDTMKFEDYEIYKITVATNNVLDIQNIKKEIENRCPKISFKRSEGNLFTITNLQATKGNAVKSVAKMLNINTDEIMVFGDNYNDISMMDIAEVRVAMGNSDKEIKDRSTHQTSDNNNNGVSEFLIKYFDL